MIAGERGEIWPPDQFVDGPTIHGKLSESGEFLPITEQEATIIAQNGASMTFTVESSDRENNTIYFSPVSPTDVEPSERTDRLGAYVKLNCTCEWRSSFILIKENE